MYKCNDCDYVFDEPVVEHDDPSPAGVALPSGCYKYYHCPKCYSESISEYWEDEYEDNC